MTHEWTTYYNKELMAQKCVHCKLEREIFFIYDEHVAFAKSFGGGYNGVDATHSAVLYYYEGNKFPIITNNVGYNYISPPFNCNEVRFRCLML